MGVEATRRGERTHDVAIRLQVLCVSTWLGISRGRTGYRFSLYACQIEKGGDPLYHAVASPSNLEDLRGLKPNSSLGKTSSGTFQVHASHHTRHGRCMSIFNLRNSGSKAKASVQLPAHSILAWGCFRSGLLPTNCNVSTLDCLPYLGSFGSASQEKHANL